VLNIEVDLSGEIIGLFNSDDKDGIVGYSDIVSTMLQIQAVSLHLLFIAYLDFACV
jgi:hypothetical protein